MTTLYIRPLICLLLVQALLSHQQTEAQVEKPRLMLNVGGPVGGIRAIAFSSDGSKLFAAGSGKIVNVWNLAGDASMQAIPAAPLRWEIARGPRGRIYTMDVAATDALAIGGYSTRDATGDLAVFDATTQQIRSLLPPERPVAAAGHTQTVGSVKLSPTGEQLVSVSLDGEVRLWALATGESEILQQGATEWDSRIRSAAFLDSRRVLVPQQDPAEPAAWRLSLVNADDVQGPRAIVSQPVFWYGVADITHTPDLKECAVSDLLGRVTIFEIADRPRPRALNRPQHQARGHAVRVVASMDYNPQRLLAITTTADASGVCWLELWDTAARPPQMILERSLGTGSAAAATAFSPDGRLLAVARADRSAVELIPVRTGPAVLDLETAIELTGRGREPKSAQFVGPDGYRIAIASGSDDRRLLFDLESLAVIDEEIPTASRPEEAAGWQLVELPPVGNTQEVQLLTPGTTTARGSIVLDTNHQGTFGDHTWLTDSQGNVYGVAVATRRQDGIFLYGLPAAGGKCRLLRYLRDHSDSINSLSVSANGQFLASAAADQTVKIWSLEGLQGVNQQFPREDAWGAVFGRDSDGVVVQSALGAGIAVHRDLLAGDHITEVRYSGTAATAPDDILAALANRPLWETLVLSTTRDGEEREPILVTPAWEPVATLFVDRSYEWAMWTPQGVYDASASGDELFGWHINVARDQEPRYFRAEKFRGKLERPDVMRELLNSGSLQDALIAVAAGQDPPRSVGDVAADLPLLRIIAPQPGTVVADGETIAVRAAIRAPANPQRTLNDFRVRLRINQREVGEPQVQRLDDEWEYTWNAAPDAAQNLIRVRVEENNGGVNALFEDATVQVRADVPPSDITLHVLALSAEQYAPGLQLAFCNDDARGVSDLLQQHEGKRYQCEHVLILTDEDGPDRLQRADVESRIKEFKEQLSDVATSDILVVFVAGHGQAYGNDYFFVPPHPDLTANLNDKQREAVVRRIGIPWETLRSLADVNCRKVFLLDTCYAGNITLAEKASIRPLKESQAIVFAATSENELALAENPVRKNHGLFTGFLLDACDGKADGVDSYAPAHPAFPPERDGNVNLKEVVSYVGVNTRQYFQKPKCAPAELLNFVDLSLFRVPGGAAPAAPAPGR